MNCILFFSGQTDHSKLNEEQMKRTNVAAMRNNVFTGLMCPVFSLFTKQKCILNVKMSTLGIEYVSMCPSVKMFFHDCFLTHIHVHTLK